MATIAAIVPSYRRWPYMLDTVQQLLSQTRVPDEIIVVDQTPPDEVSPDERRQLRELQSAHASIRFFFQTEPHVYKARNRAAAATGADLLLYLDDDVRLDPDLVQTYLDVLRDPGIDAVVGRNESAGSDSRAFVVPDRSLPPALFAFQFLPVAEERMEGIPYCCAGNVCIRRSSFVDVGGWDERVLTYGDKDMGLRLFKAGKYIVYEPRAKMFHLRAPLGGTRLTDRRAPWSSWQRCVSIHYLAFRHLEGAAFWQHGPLRALRYTVLLKQNFKRPWRWLPETYGWARGLVTAWRWSRGGTVCSFDLGAARAGVEPEPKR